MSRIVKKPEERRQEIIIAARTLFLKNGYDATTMQNIVTYLDIAKGTIYHYFKCKEELLEAVVEDIAEEDHKRKKLALHGMNGDALKKIRNLLELNNSSIERDELLEELHQPENIGLHTRLLAVVVLKEAILYAELIQQGCEEGFFETKFPRECAEFFLSGVQFLTDIGIYPWTSEDLKRRAKAFPSMIELLLNAPKGSFRFLLDRLEKQ